VHFALAPGRHGIYMMRPPGVFVVCAAALVFMPQVFAAQSEKKEDQKKEPKRPSSR
jgi:hypothetical protein